MSIIKDNFDATIKRSEYFLDVYDIVCVNPSTFPEEYAPELLRASLVTAVSALDRYMHDLIVNRCLLLLSNEDVPKSLGQLPIPASTVKEIIDNAKRGGRPNEKLKAKIMDIVHRFTFQSSGKIDKCMSMLGEKDFWSRVSREIGGNATPENLQKELNEKVMRRNRIVHEGDLGKKVRQRTSKKSKETSKTTGQPPVYEPTPIDKKYAKDSVDFIKSFIDAVDKVIEAG